MDDFFNILPRRNTGNLVVYYGFKLAAVLWVYYGLTLGMKFGAWGFFAPEISREVGFSATEIGLVAAIVLAGTAVFTPIAGLFISRYGCKRSMIVGLALGAGGMLATSISRDLSGFSVGAVLLAASTSFSGVVPIQTLTTLWFDKYRSRAMAIIFTGTPIWGALSYPLYDYMLTLGTWRMALVALTLIFPLGFVLVLLFVKDSPEQIGERVDGIEAKDSDEFDASENASKPQKSATEDDGSVWTVKTALLSPLFALITLSVVVCTLPYLFFVTYGRLLLESVNVSTDVAVAALAGLTLATLAGRLSASLADFVDARLLVMGALVSNLTGITAILTSQTDPMVFATVFLMGLSFGLAFIMAPILLARVFGRTVFAPIEGMRMSIVVGLNAGLMPLFGYLIEVSGSYLLPLQIILGVNGIAVIGLALNMLLARFRRLESA